MNILLTGDKGYIGSILAPRLLAGGHQVRGFDIGFFEDCALSPTNENYPQIVKDIRDIERVDVEGVDAIVHLAGLSNDPLGELSSKLTEEIESISKQYLQILKSGRKPVLLSKKEMKKNVKKIKDYNYGKF